ncbi:MAG: ferredoxin [Acidimicrobiia bacterium]
MTTIWIDTNECMGAGTCEQIAPELFASRSDGTWVVKEDASFFGQTIVFDGVAAPDGREGRARVPEGLVETAFEAADECPGECIHLEA